MKGIALAVSVFLAAASGSAARTAKTVADLEPALAKVAAFEYGQSRDPLYEVRDFVRASLSDAQALRAIESRLIRMLEAKPAPGGTDFICRQLRLIGTEASVPVLAGMAQQPDTANVALYALSSIPGPAADYALRKMLANTSGPVKVAVVNALGHRRDTGSTTALEALVSSSEPALAEAAVAALGRAGNGPALAALAGARGRATGSLRLRASEAYVQCAGRLAERGETAAALKVFRELLGPREPAQIRVAALSGLAAHGGEAAMPVLGAEVGSKEPRVQAAAIRLLGAMPGPEPGRVLLERFSKLAPAGQVRVLTALAGRREGAAKPTFVSAANAPSAEVRIAALAGLGQLGDTSHVMLLAQTAAARTGDEREAARESLNYLSGSDADSTILAAIGSTSGTVRTELIRAAGDRGIPEAAGPLLAAARDPDRSVRREALRALRNVGRQEHVPALLELVQQASGATDRNEAAQMLATVLRRSEKSQIGVLVNSYRQAASSESRAALLGVMGQGAWEETLPVVRSALKDSDPEVCRAAILALTDWETPVPMTDLLELARSASSPTHRVLALRGYLTLLGVQANRSTLDSVRLVSDAMALAKAPEEKKSILSLLARYSSEESLVLAEKWLNDPDVAREAKYAVEAINTQLEFSRPLKVKR